MKSIFEPKNEIALDLTIFERMKGQATKLLSDIEKSEYTQAIILLSTTGNTYSSIIRNALSEGKADEASLLQQIQDAKDDEIHFVLCMWQDKNIDIPSFSFRKSLLNANEKNSESMLFVMTADGVSATKLSTTMK